MKLENSLKTFKEFWKETRVRNTHTTHIEMHTVGACVTDPGGSAAAGVACVLYWSAGSQLP